MNMLSNFNLHNIVTLENNLKYKVDTFFLYLINIYIAIMRMRDIAASIIVTYSRLL